MLRPPRSRGDPEGMARRQFSLCDGEVDDIMRTADVASGVDVRLAGLLPAIHRNATVGPETNAGLLESETRGGRLPPEGVEEMAGPTGQCTAAALESDCDPAVVPADLLDAGVCVQIHALRPEGPLDDGAGLRGMVPQDVRAALNERHP